jgi:hypothetical protein
MASQESRPELETLQRWQMQARYRAAKDQAAAEWEEAVATVQFWNEHVRGPDEAPIPLPGRPAWLDD